MRNKNFKLIMNRKRREGGNRLMRERVGKGGNAENDLCMIWVARE